MTKAQKQILDDRQDERRKHWSRLCWGNFGQLEWKHFRNRPETRVQIPGSNSRVRPGPSEYPVQNLGPNSVRGLDSTHQHAQVLWI